MQAQIVNQTLMLDTKANDSGQELRDVFGPEAVFSHVGKFVLVHLDDPTPEEVEHRIAEFDPEQYFTDDCPLCQMLKQDGGAIIFDL